MPIPSSGGNDGSDRRIQYSDLMTGADDTGLLGKPDTLNRLSIHEHKDDGSHKDIHADTITINEFDPDNYSVNLNAHMLQGKTADQFATAAQGANGQSAWDAVQALKSPINAPRQSIVSCSTDTTTTRPKFIDAAGSLVCKGTVAGTTVKPLMLSFAKGFNTAGPLDTLIAITENMAMPPVPAITQIQISDSARFSQSGGTPNRITVKTEGTNNVKPGQVISMYNWSKENLNAKNVLVQAASSSSFSYDIPTDIATLGTPISGSYTMNLYLFAELSDVTLVGSGSVDVVATTTQKHLLAVGQEVFIQNADFADYNGLFTVKQLGDLSNGSGNEGADPEYKFHFEAASVTTVSKQANFVFLTFSLYPPAYCYGQPDFVGSDNDTLAWFSIDEMINRVGSSGTNWEVRPRIPLGHFEYETDVPGISTVRMYSPGGRNLVRLSDDGRVLAANKQFEILHLVGSKPVIKRMFLKCVSAYGRYSEGYEVDLPIGSFGFTTQFAFNLCGIALDVNKVIFATDQYLFAFQPANPQDDEGGAIPSNSITYSKWDLCIQLDRGF